MLLLLLFVVVMSEVHVVVVVVMSEVHVVVDISATSKHYSNSCFFLFQMCASSLLLHRQ